jgi:hypothetical protein
MKPTIAILGRPHFPLETELVTFLERLTKRTFVGSIDAPLEGKPVSIGPDGVLWEGIDLTSCDLVFVQQQFPWPQPQQVDRYDDAESWQTKGAAEREARALAIAAVSIAARYCRVVNRPDSMHQTAAPAISLDRLARSGFVVHQWSLEPAPQPDQLGARFVIDACGRDRWHVPERPAPGQPAIVFEPVTNEIVTLLMAGGGCIAAVHHRDGSEWTSSPGKRVALNDLDAAHVSLALDAARCLELDLAGISLVTSNPSTIVFVEPSPDLDQWHRIVGTDLIKGLGESLIRLVANDRMETL